MSTPTALYRLFGDEDVLLYIGISKSFGPRWHHHAHAQPWWHEVRRQGIEWHESRGAADAAEKAAIKAEHPKYNVIHAKPEDAATRKPARAPRPFDVDFGGKARRLRRERKLRQGQVAAAMASRGNRWHPNTVARIEAGVHPVTLSEVMDLAAVFGVPWESLCPTSQAVAMEAAA